MRDLALALFLPAGPLAASPPVDRGEASATRIARRPVQPIASRTTPFPRESGIARVLATPGIAERRIPYRELRSRLRASVDRATWAHFPQRSWEHFRLRERWIGEHVPGFVSKGTERRPVVYLRGEEARAPLRVHIGEDGRLYDGHDRRLNLAPQSLLVEGPDGELYARDIHDIERDAEGPGGLKFAHSSFWAGAALPMSVEVTVVNGVVRAAKNRSGHYRPDRLTFMSWLVRKEQQGLNLSDALISFDRKSAAEDERGSVTSAETPRTDGRAP